MSKLIKIDSHKKQGQIALTLTINTGRFRDFSSKLSALSAARRESAKNYVSAKAKILKLLVKCLVSNKAQFTVSQDQEYEIVEFKLRQAIKDEEGEQQIAITKSIKRRERKLSKVMASLLILALISQMTMFGALLGKVSTASAQELCPVDVDVVLIIDTSASMAEGQNDSVCRYKELNLIGGFGFCDVNYNTELGLTETECADLHSPACGSYSYQSGSLSKIKSAKNAAISFLDNMTSNDQSALVSFSTTAVLRQGLTNNHSLTETAINNLTTSGATNIGDAIALSVAQLTSANANPQAVKAAILLTDGKANKPNGDGFNENQQDVDYAIEQATIAAGHSIRVYTIGLGSDGDVNEAMLQTIAETTQAQYYSTPNGDGLEEIYGQIAVGLCEIPVCGNAITEEGEQCDDGNYADGDGCSAICQIEQSFVCSNGLDDDQDTLIDEHDPGCYSSGQYDPLDGDEADALPACSDFFDNDNDGLTDYLDDPGCQSSSDSDEADEAHPPIEGIQPGDLIITEIMQDPVQVSDTNGEWFEIYNKTQAAIDLNACVISDLNGDSHAISSSSPILVSSLGYVVLARNGNSATNGGVNVGYVYSGFTLGNDSDEIILTCDNVEIDRVEYDGGPNFPDPSGASMILANPALNNNVGSNWCESTTPYGAGDLGTPGAVNDSCSQCGSSISGFKRDAAGAGLADWTINLNDGQGGLITSTTTDSTGYYYFTNLCPADYQVAETLQSGWQQISPSNPNYWSLSIDGTASTTTSTIDFVNSELELGSISGHKYQDTDNNASTTADWVGLSGWIINLHYASTTTVIASTTTDSLGFYEFTGLDYRDYKVTEVLLTDWTQLLAPDPEIGLTAATTSSTGNNFVNYYSGTAPEPEPEPAPSNGGAGGGGGGGIAPLVIFNEQNVQTTNEAAEVSWFTNKLATCYVVYDIVSHPTSEMGASPDYGYAYSTVMTDTPRTFHSQIIGDLAPETTYYWRPICTDSHEVFGRELSFVTLGGQPEPETPGQPTGGTGQEPSGPGTGTGEPGQGAAPSGPGTQPTTPPEVIEPPVITETVEMEEEPGFFANLLAAIGNFADLDSLCGILNLLLILITILYVLSRKKLLNIPDDEKRYWDLVVSVIILVIFAWVLKCWLLWIPIVIILIYGVFYYLRKKPDQIDQL